MSEVNSPEDTKDLASLISGSLNKIERERRDWQTSEQQAELTRLYGEVRDVVQVTDTREETPRVTIQLREGFVEPDRQKVYTLPLRLRESEIPRYEELAAKRFELQTDIGVKSEADRELLHRITQEMIAMEKRAL